METVSIMGDRNLDRKKGKQRGSVKNANRLAGLGGKASLEEGDWTGADAEVLRETIGAVTAAGGAITFGLSRDKGAHMLTVMLDGDRAVLWFNGDADLTLELEKVTEYVKSLGDVQTP